MYGKRIAIAALFTVDLVGATLYTDANQLPTDTFDFVIIGGEYAYNLERPRSKNAPAGSAGNVVATRLTEDPNCSVLVIEAGIKFARCAYSIA